MKLHQLRSFEAIVAHDFSVTRAAEHLHATQPGVTKHIQLLEAELGVELFVRHKKRFVGLTPAGTAILPIAGQAIEVLGNLQRTARRFQGVDTLAIATSPTPARVFFPSIIKQFSRRYPATRVHVVTGNVNHSVNAVLRGEADFCICSAPQTPSDQIEFFSCYEQRWLLLVPPGHELLGKPSPTLADIARQPLITYEEGYTSRAIIVDAFTQQGLVPNIVLDATDSDIMMRYVRSGLGVAIVGSQAYDSDEEDELAAIDLSRVIPSARMHLGIRRGAVPSQQVMYFFKLFAPQLAPQIELFVRSYPHQAAPAGLALA